VNFAVAGRGKVPKTARSRQKRAEGAGGGAANRCYGKSSRIKRIALNRFYLTHFTLG